MSKGPQTPEEQLASRKKFILNFFYFAIIFALSIVFVRLALPHLWAFVIAFIVIMILKGPARFLHNKWKLDYKTGAVILVLLFYATIGTGVFFAILGIVNKLIDFILLIPNFVNGTVAPAFQTAVDSVEKGITEINEKYNLTLDLNIENYIANFLTGISELISKASTTVISGTKDVAVSFSSVLINVVICIVSTAFGLMDYEIIVDWIKTQLSKESIVLIDDVPTKIIDETNYKKFTTVVSSLVKIVGKYVVSYGFIMIITFLELSAGLGVVIHNSNVFLYAAIIAVFDILPIIGSGLFLFPWAVISMFSGDIGKGIGLLIVWFIISVIRNIIEPKIVGTTVGMHPLLTLFAMIAGQFIYGPIGILLCPIAVALIQVLNTAGIIHIYKPTEGKTEPKRSKIGKILSFPIEFVADNVLSFFKWLHNLVFKSPPKDPGTMIDEMKEHENPDITVDIPDEMISGSPEAAGSGPRKLAEDAAKKQKKTK